MSNIKKLFFLAFFFSLLACADDEDATNEPQIIGTYLGTLEVFHENGSSEMVADEELDIILISQDEALIQFTTSLLNGTTVYNYNASFAGDFTLLVDRIEVNPGTEHNGQASLVGQQISVVINDANFGDQILKYEGERL